MDTMDDVYSTILGGIYGGSRSDVIVLAAYQTVIDDEFIYLAWNMRQRENGVVDYDDPVKALQALELALEAEGSSFSFSVVFTNSLYDKDSSLRRMLKAKANTITNKDFENFFSQYKATVEGDYLVMEPVTIDGLIKHLPAEEVEAPHIILNEGEKQAFDVDDIDDVIYLFDKDAERVEIDLDLEQLFGK